MPPDRVHDSAPPARIGLLVAAGVCVAIPIVALMWVGSYAREDPKLGPFPFFFWYQFLWVFLTAGFVVAAYRLVLKGRPYRPMLSAGEPPVDGGDLHLGGADEEGSAR